MGTDNIHHQKKAKSFERRSSVKAPGKRFLIVCEGEKTEPHYFKELRHSLRIKTATVEICGKECGSDPVSVFQYAQKIDLEEQQSPFDAIYCVIDKDDHKNLEKALRLIGDQGERYIAVLSYPCFEYWLLLHHDLRRTSFVKTSRKSIGDAVNSELRKHDKNYVKGKSGVWLRYYSKLDIAMHNARLVLKAAKASGNFNPSTNVHELVETLVNL